MPKVYISGAVGKIEAMYHPPRSDDSPTILLLHPHPLYGGTMNNKIIFGLFKLCVAFGFGTLRMNFRGVGRSDGQYDNGIGELTDANLALNWLQNYNQNSTEHYVAGFSFGAYIAMQLVSRRPELKGFVLLSPPISKYNCSFFTPCARSGLIVDGTNDVISKPIDNSRFISGLKLTNDAYITYKTIDNGDHFFTGHENELYQTIESYFVDMSIGRKL